MKVIQRTKLPEGRTERANADVLRIVTLTGATRIPTNRRRQLQYGATIRLVYGAGRGAGCYFLATKAGMEDVNCQTLSSGEMVIQKIFYEEQDWNLKDPDQPRYEQAQRLGRNEDSDKRAESSDA